MAMTTDNVMCIISDFRNCNFEAFIVMAISSKWTDAFWRIVPSSGGINLGNGYSCKRALIHISCILILAFTHLYAGWHLYEGWSQIKMDGKDAFET